MDIPNVSKALLAQLEARFPDRSPKLDTPERKVWFDAGRASVVALIRSWWEQVNLPQDPEEE